jgi:hypothetical protein
LVWCQETSAGKWERRGERPKIRFLFIEVISNHRAKISDDGGSAWQFSNADLVAISPAEAALSRCRALRANPEMAQFREYSMPTPVAFFCPIDSELLGNDC